MISIGDVLALVKTFWQTYQGFKTNQEECCKLWQYSKTMLQLMEDECGTSTPSKLEESLAKYARYVA